MTIDILCRVVDNYGDIGVVFRLARALSELEGAPRLRLVVDDLGAFKKLLPEVDPSLLAQRVRGWELFAWSGHGGLDYGPIRDSYGSVPPAVVLECFACGRPEWLEELLFDERNPAVRTIVNVEYLSAEDYAEDLHRIPSLTRSSAVRKHMFLPGFTAGTGGLILDSAFRDALSAYSPGAAIEQGRSELLSKLAPGSGLGADATERTELAERFWVTVFGYERDYGPMVADLAAYGARRPIAVFVASGKSEACFFSAWERAGRPFRAVRLPFVAQEAWDELLAASDFLVVRGEDSLSRAALSGKPFIWHAYPQEAAYQLVKVRAFLGRLRPFFGSGSVGAFGALESAYIAFNDRLSDEPGTRGGERILPILDAYDALVPGFRAFSDDLARNGDLAANLMTFLREIV